MAAKLAPPRGLGDAGKALWRAITGQLEGDGLTPDARESIWLELAAREADQLATIESALAGEALIVRGSRGQDVSHPLLAEARSSRQTIAALLARVGLEDPASVVVGRGSRTTSTSARRAAHVRHHGRGA